MVSYKMLHYSLFPPLCKKSENECGRKILENILKWKKLADFLSSMCTVKTLIWPTTSSNQSHMLSAEPSTWLCTTQAQFFPWFKNVNDLMLENPGGTKKHSHARRCTTMYTTPALNKKKEDKDFHVFHCSSNHINLAAQRYMKLSGSFPGSLADPHRAVLLQDASDSWGWYSRGRQCWGIRLYGESCAAMELQNGDTAFLLGPAALREKEGKAICWLQHLAVRAHPAENSFLSWSPCAFSQALPLRCLDATT